MDYWALGVLLFEFVNGTPPFCADEPMRIFDNILSNRIKMRGAGVGVSGRPSRNS